jgi:hypothetical protein
MKAISILILSFFCLTFGQVNAQDFSKEDLIGTWRACGAYDWDEEADTLMFQRATPPCRDHDCAEHDWSFRETGSIEFIFTKGCETGFNSKSKNPKRWMYRSEENRLKFITNDGWVEYFDIVELTEDKLVLIHRKDLEAD